MVVAHLVERDASSGKIQRVFDFGREGIMERARDLHGPVLRRFVYERERNAIEEFNGENDERVSRTLTFHDDHATISEGGKYGRITHTFLISPDHVRVQDREGGKFGPVRRTFIFDERGILEKEGEEFRDIRMFIFEKIGSITERQGGWFGKTRRIFFGEGMGTDSFRDPQGFLQLLFLIG